MKPWDGISFNGKHSFRDYGLILATAPDFGTPEPKFNYVEIPGRDGVLDYSEAAAGEIKYNNRQMRFEFVTMIEAEKRERLRSELWSDLNGRNAEIIYDLDSDWYYTGRCTVAFEDVKSWKMRVVITVDAKPYKLAMENTVITVDPSSFASEVVKLGQGTEAMHHNTIFEFGSASDPLLDLTAYSELYFIFPDPGVWGDPVLQIVDSAGQTYNDYVMLNSVVDGMQAMTLDVDDITGITKTNVYRILCQNRSLGILKGKTLASATVLMPVDRMSVVPKWTVVDDNDLALSDIVVQVNGKMYTITEGVSYNYNIILKEGEQEVTFFADSDGITVTAEYQDGRL